MSAAHQGHRLVPTSASLATERALRASRTTPLANHLADDEKPWADHLSPAEREHLSTYLAAHPDKAPAHLAGHLAHVGILPRPGVASSTAGPQSDPAEKEQS